MKTIFEDIHGQAKALENLYRIYISGKIPHAFLFVGPNGCGKYFSAIKFAQLINSSNDNVQTEAISRKICSLQEPYLKYIIPLPRGKNETGSSLALEKIDKDSLELIREELESKIKNPYHRIRIDNANTIKITSIREIKKFISLNYDDIKYRFIIISDAHLMNDEAQNALLKSLEEPPDGIIFILTTNNINALLPTILSRCRIINFNPLNNENVIKILTEYFQTDMRTALNVSSFANGSIYTALDFIDNDFELLLNKTINILRYSLALKFHSAYNEISYFSSDTSGKSLILLIQMIIAWLADVQKNKINYDQYIFKDYKDTLIKFNQRFSNTDFLGNISNFERMIFAIDNNANLNIVILNIIFEISSLRF